MEDHVIPDITKPETSVLARLDKLEGDDRKLASMGETLPDKLLSLQAKIAELERRLDKLDRQQPLTLSSWK